MVWRKDLQTNLRWLTVLAGVSICAIGSSGANAQQLEVAVEIPRLQVAEYHRPYVAIWIEPQGGGDINDLAVWYDTALKDREGEKWLKDMRQWWRRSGRALTMPVDGVSGATRPPGGHTLKVDSQKLKSLVAGEYRLMIEAAREVGGREMLTIPFVWPPTQLQTLEANGEHELGKVSLQLVPVAATE